MNQYEYIKERVDDQITWYSKKSSNNQRWYKRWRLVEILAAALIPFLTSYTGDTGNGPMFKIIVGALGMLVAVISGLLVLYKFQDNWVEYRNTCELLTSEKFLFETQAPPYNTPDAFPNFVQKIEALITSENQKWTQYIMAAGKEAPPASPAFPSAPEAAPTPAEPAQPDAETQPVAPTPPLEAPTPPSTESASAAPPDPAPAEEIVTESNASAMQFDPALTDGTASGETKP